MGSPKFEKEDFKRQVTDNVKRLYCKTVDKASQEELFQAVSYAVKDAINEDWIATRRTIDKEDPKTVYYMSMEFLLGRALGNNLINMTAYDEVKEALDEMGINLDAVEDEEPDPALGNGGLGRLAACFLDSLSTLGYAAYGCGVRYQYGMFRQKIVDGYQVEEPDHWLENGNPFEVKRPDLAKIVKFGGYVRMYNDEETGYVKFRQEDYSAVLAVPYDYPIVGYGDHMVNTLRIWDAGSASDFPLDTFEKGDYLKAMEPEDQAKELVQVLYPEDSHYAGKELRLKQQYFFVSASLQTAVENYMQHHDDIRKLPEKITIQMNDTHPTVAVAELMRILIDDYDLSWDDAWEITTHTCAYTNHTIMAEALEKWPIDLFSGLLPRVYQIIQEIDRRFVDEIRARYPGDEDRVYRMRILCDGQVRMAYLAIAAGYSVNGVARLHTEILEKRELKDFYEMMPEKFNNKTNGITQRRFLLHGNPELAAWVTKKLGSDAWITDLDQLAGLKPLTKDPQALKEFMQIKYDNKVRLAAYIKKHNDIEVDPNSLFDIQAKRLHEYKRQMLNIMNVIYQYNQLKAHPRMKFTPRTYIFGAKAAAGYKLAKQTIKLINSVAEVINNDPAIKGKIKVVFIEDYKVSNAELLFAAADVSEQISTASKEASGTGNMKFMLNGAVTIGTMDGANVEMVEEVGEENAFIFGLSSDEVIAYEKDGGYDPWDIYRSDPDVRKILDQLVDGTFAHGDTEMYRELHDSLLYRRGNDAADRFFVLKDFRSYADAQEKIGKAYEDQEGWAKMALMNTACCGKFSSDRTIHQYVDDIWKLDKITVDVDAAEEPAKAVKADAAKNPAKAGKADAAEKTAKTARSGKSGKSGKTGGTAKTSKAKK